MITTRINGTRVTLGFTRDGIPFVALDKRGGMRVTKRFPQGESVAYSEFYREQVNLMPETAYDGTKCWVRGQIDDDLTLTD